MHLRTCLLLEERSLNESIAKDTPDELAYRRCCTGINGNQIMQEGYDPTAINKIDLPIQARNLALPEPRNDPVLEMCLKGMLGVVFGDHVRVRRAWKPFRLSRELLTRAKPHLMLISTLGSLSE